MNNAWTTSGFELKILANDILERIKADERIVADETTLSTLVHGSGKQLGAWLWAWAYAHDDRLFGALEPLRVACQFEDS